MALRRPLVGVALAVACGMAAAATGLFPFGLLLFAALFVLLLALLFFRTRASLPLALLFVGLVAACRFWVGSAALAGSGINRLLPTLPLESVEVAGRVAGDPKYYPYRTGPLGSWVFPLDCEGVKTSKDWKRRRGRIQVRVSGARPEEVFRQGERICFSGTLRRRTFPGGDPIELSVSASKGWKPLSAPPRFSPATWGQRWRERAAVTLSNGIENRPDQLAVYRALLLGYRKAVPPAIHQRFKRTGTLHIFAISGLHVGIVGLLITIVLKTAGIPRDKWGLWLLPLLFAYVATTGMKSSALRALCMAAVYFLAPLFRRKPDIPTSIAFAAILLLFFRPLEILSPGFVFSFTVVGFIVMVFSIVPERIVARGKGWLNAIRVYAVSLVITSVAAFIASVPLTALFFGSFAGVSLFANLLVVPLTFCIVLSGWLSILVPVASEIFNHAALVFIDSLLGTVGFLSRLPHAYVQIDPPALTGLFFWYAGWIALLVHARTARQRIACLALVLFSLLWMAV